MYTGSQAKFFSPGLSTTVHTNVFHTQRGCNDLALLALVSFSPSSAGTSCRTSIVSKVPFCIVQLLQLYSTVLYSVLVHEKVVPTSKFHISAFHDQPNNSPSPCFSYIVQVTYRFSYRSFYLVTMVVDPTKRMPRPHRRKGH